MEEPRDPGRYVLRDRHRAGGRRHAVGADDAAGEDRELLTGLAPLRWLTEEDLIYEPATETLHRPDCGRVVSPATARALPAGTALERMTAPRFCECRPDVTTTLSAPRLER